jgi:hypothetical protein
MVILCYPSISDVRRVARILVFGTEKGVRSYYSGKEMDLELSAMEVTIKCRENLFSSEADCPNAARLHLPIPRDLKIVRQIRL